MKKKLIICFSLLLFCLTLSGCIPGDGSASSYNPAGFLSGVWHGWIAPFTLVLSFFRGSRYGIYEIANNGFPYDLGFYMAIISGFGGLALARKKSDKK